MNKALQFTVMFEVPAAAQWPKTRRHCFSRRESARAASENSLEVKLQ
jgi:hypothetical protein